MKQTLATLWLLLVVAACGDSATRAAQPSPLPAVLLVTTSASEPSSLRLRDHGSGTSRPLTPELHAAWAPCVTHDARGLCFLGRASAESKTVLYTGELAQASFEACGVHVDPRSAPAWLPDGRMVYAADAGDGSRALFVTGAPFARARRITFDGIGAADPTVLRDGRILYVGTSLEHGPEGRPALYTIHPDGTGVTLFHSDTRARGYSRPRQGPESTVVFVAHDERATAVALDWRAPHAGGRRLDLPGDVRALAALADGGFMILVGGDDAGETLVLQHAGDRGPGTRVPGMDAHVTDLCVAAPRARPQGHLSMLRDEMRPGRLLCVDAHTSDSAVRAAAVRVHVRSGEAGDTSAWRVLGETRLESDGSFFVDVPADVPLRLDVLDGEGVELSGTRTPFWVRPGETRGCVGCHARPDATPPNRMPAAALLPPRALTGMLTPEAER